MFGRVVADTLFERFRLSLMASLTIAMSVGLVSCSVSQNSVPMCSKTQSLLRFDTKSAPRVVDNLQYLSNGGFIEVYTRKEMFGPVDSYRICTAYIEFSDSPAESETVLLSESLKMNIYTAAHCLDLSKDHSLKLFFYDTQGRAYDPIQIAYPLLNKVQDLRKSMKSKGLTQEQQRTVLNALRTNVHDLKSLFNQPTMSSTTTGAGSSVLGGQTCLKTDDAVMQNVCSTYHDLIEFKVEPVATTPAPIIDSIKQFRKDSTKRLSEWIAKSKLAAKFADPSFKPAFADEKSNPLDLIGVHKAVRSRVQTYSKFKMLQYVHDDLLDKISACTSGQSEWFCPLAGEFSELIQTALSGTKYEKFESSELASIVDILKSDYTASLQKMDTIMTILEPLIVTNSDGAKALPLDTRIHSNFRFVTTSDSTSDNPDPRDTLRAFMIFNVNNLSGDVTGARSHLIRWNTETKLGRFHHLEIPRTVAAGSSAGFLQAGDSGSIVVVEHLPYFAVTSVDGVSTSGGATIRPLPEPIEEEPAQPVKICQ